MALPGGGRTAVSRRGAVVLRAGGPWSRTVIGLLRHLQDAGYASSPRVIGDGIGPDGRELLAFVEGTSAHPGPWPDEVLPRIGAALRDLHRATASFRPPEGAVWREWYGRSLGAPLAFGHGDAAPWNLLVRPDGGLTLIDWETAGPIDPLIELAQACWLNAQLHDDDIARRQGLADAATRARHLRLIVDGYGLARADRAGLVDRMVEVAVAGGSGPRGHARRRRRRAAVGHRLAHPFGGVDAAAAADARARGSPDRRAGPPAPVAGRGVSRGRAPAPPTRCRRDR